MFQRSPAPRSRIADNSGALCARHARSTVESSREALVQGARRLPRRWRPPARLRGCPFNHWELAGNVAGVSAVGLRCLYPQFRAIVLRCASQRRGVARGPRGFVNSTVKEGQPHGRRAARRRSAPRSPADPGGFPPSSWTIVQLRWGSATAAHPSSLAKSEAVGDDCDMEHRMSDAELRKAIRVLRERADDARHRGNDDDANGIERTIRTYQEEMTQRL